MSAPSFEDHVALIQKQEGIDEGPAKWRAWLEGPDGFERRQKREAKEKTDD